MEIRAIQSRKTPPPKVQGDPIPRFVSGALCVRVCPGGRPDRGSVPRQCRRTAPEAERVHGRRGRDQRGGAGAPRHTPQPRVLTCPTPPHPLPCENNGKRAATGGHKEGRHFAELRPWVGRAETGVLCAHPEKTGSAMATCTRMA